MHRSKRGSQLGAALVAALSLGLTGAASAQKLASAETRSDPEPPPAAAYGELLPQTLLPGMVLALPATVAHLLVADLERNRLHLYAHDQGELRLLNSMYSSIGKAGYGKQVEGDMLTPVGIYTITSWISGETLPPLYGDGAWPVDYPNPLDRYEGRTGHGIWLHGNPPSSVDGQRPPRSSEGCLTVANADLATLQPFVRLQQTPIIFADALTWIDSEERAAGLQQVQNLLDEWQIAWESLDPEALGAHYAAGARIGGLDRATFIEQKRQVNSRKEWIQLRLTALAAYRYPGGPRPRLQVEFDQDYRSNNYQSQGRKRQYWEQQADGRWQILLEIPLS